MPKKLTTLYIEDNEIKLLVTNGKAVEKWASLLLDPGMVNEGIVMQEDAVAERIRSLADSQGVGGATVIAAMSGLNSIFRLINLPEVPKNILDDAVHAEGARVIPVPMDQVYLARQQLESGAAHELRFFLAAHPKNATDALMRVIHKAGLKVKVLDIAPLALARSVHVSRAVVVNTWLSSIDIIILVDRVPEVIRSFSLPADAASDAERMAGIAEEVDRTVTFYNSSHAEAALGADVPILVSGELAHAQDSWGVLGGTQGRPVELLTADFTAPEGFDMTQFMVNIGLAEREMPGSEFGSLIALNAIPEQYLPKGVNWFNILAPAVGVLLIGALVYGWFYVQDIMEQTDTIQPQIDALQLQTTQEQAKLAGLTAQVTAADAAIAPVQKEALAVQTAYLTLREQREYASGAVRASWTVHSPTTITIGTIDWDGTTVVITGTASVSETNVFTYASALRDTGRFQNVVITSVVKRLTTDTLVYVYDFTLTLF